MYAAISRSEARQPASDRQLNRADGELDLRFTADPTSPLGRLYQRSPARVLFPRPEAGEPVQAVLLNTAGGLTGGDRWRAEIGVDPDAKAVVTTQAAEKLYRAIDRPTEVQTRLRVGAGARLEWLPQETILFDSARLERRLEVELDAEAQLLAVEMLVFGRRASGERFRRGALRDDWRIRRQGRLVWADALRLDGEIARTLKRAATFAGAAAVATLLHAGADAEAARATARALFDGYDGRAGASLVNGLLVCRLLDGEPQRLKAMLGRLIAGLRQHAGLPARLPKVWVC